MTYQALIYLYTSFILPGSVSQSDPSPVLSRMNRPPGDKPPRKPDWLLILVAILSLITLFIAWLVDIPGLLR
ncbi:hypothetical protein HNV11_20220 [Spirosoma taeanense]|uniref:Uncharacterized protein n=1 Tax=Spirosoma taeanense TaxID=2735870 RepID=A0A6M5YBN3_9BACT|nr:hypothetical protein [Spirosoma taeanense]QJW91538.1 hypothetical protein HNV11_20220 [Spirosoma taeanense]